MSEASSSEIAMYRAAIALAWADHELSDEEKIRLTTYMENNGNLSETQREQLKEELTRPIDMDDVWPEITEVRDRAHVLNMADAIFWEDGQLCHSEKEVLEKIKSAHMATLDVDSIREDMRAYRNELLADRQRFQQELHELRSPFGRMVHYLETMVGKVLF